MEDYLKHAIELVKAQASVRVMSEDEIADMIASLASKLKKFDTAEECNKRYLCQWGQIKCHPHPRAYTVLNK